MNDPFPCSLPQSSDIAAEIYATAKRGRRLRALYRILREIEQDRTEHQTCISSPGHTRGEVQGE